MTHTTAAWTLDELRVIDAAMRDRALLVVELDDERTEWQGVPDEQRDGMRYAVCGQTVVGKPRKDGRYCTNVNAQRWRPRKKQLETPRHSVAGLYASYADALLAVVAGGHYEGPSQARALEIVEAHTDRRWCGGHQNAYESKYGNLPERPGACGDRENHHAHAYTPGEGAAEPQPEPEPTAAATKPATVTAIDTKRTTYADKRAAKKAANRALAAEVRAAGLHPNGDVWQRAKALHAAGVAITADSLTGAQVAV